MCSVSSAERSTEWADPPKGTPASSFYRHKKGRCTCTGDHGSHRRFPESRGCSGRYCGKYTVGYGARRGSRPGHRPWSCGDRAGVLAAPAGGVVVAVGGIVLQAWHGGVSRVLQAKVLSRPRPEPLPRVVPMPF